MVTYSTPLLMELVPILPHRNSLIQAKHLEIWGKERKHLERDIDTDNNISRELSVHGACRNPNMSGSKIFTALKQLSPATDQQTSNATM
ncbi:hypothetical protein VNO80_23354 [Phaseolus coccineus]|uniref:Uncharacterized protein n=1 Tax=Phaseolus coccineus TaxID=3886 RepID=A0AAN9M5N6_PHACN